MAAMFPIQFRVSYGNVKGSSSFHQEAAKEGTGLYWEDRIPKQVASILGFNSDMFFATECRNENNQFLRLRDALRDKDPKGNWQAEEGDHDNICFYRGSVFDTASHTDHQFTGTNQNRGFTHIKLRHKPTKQTLEFVNTHFSNGDKGDRVKMAKQLRDFCDGRPIVIMTGDFNSTSESKGYPRDIFKKAGWLGIRDRGPVVRGKSGTSPDGKSFLEDLFTKPKYVASMDDMEVIASRKLKLSDHTGWLAARVTALVNYTPPGGTAPADPDAPITVVVPPPVPATSLPDAKLWNVRLRDPNLRLLDGVQFSSLTLVRNYNAPPTAVLTGRLSDLRVLMQPGYGAVITNGDGQQFSGYLTAAQRNGDGTGSVTLAGDLARLWERVCYPTPQYAWDGQTLAQDSVTGTAEARILSFVDRNAGPNAWYSTITGTDPGETNVFTQWKVIFLNDRDKDIAAFVENPTSHSIYVTQIIDAKTTRLIRTDENGIQQTFMTLSGGGSADILYLSQKKQTDGSSRTSLTLPYGGKGLDQPNLGTWVKIEYDAESTMTAANAKKTTVPAPPTTTLPRRQFLQGETNYDGYVIRLYGSPYTNAGSTQSPATPAFLEFIKDNKILRTVACDFLGRGQDGNPYDGYLRPSGLQTATVNGQPCLIVGFQTGTTTAKLVGLRLYSLPLKPAASPAQDRRVKGLVMPVNEEDRGATAKTDARFDTLGTLCATLAESADLGLNIEQAYDVDTGSPFLRFFLSDAPDLTDAIRIGPPEFGGPVQLGEDWTYTAAYPTVTTGLGAAGGLGSDRILRYDSEEDTESVWGARVEKFIDLSDQTDLSDIADAINQTILDGVNPSTVSVTVGRSLIRWGIDVPMGSRVLLVLDGQPVIERIRQTTTVVANTGGQPREETTAVIGSTDAPVKTPVQKQLAAMLRRLQHLERT